MQQKKFKILYWIVTILFALSMLGSGIAELIGSEQGDAVLIHLGYPMYISIILGIAKVIGSIVIVQYKYKTLKEWAYAGFTIDFIGASASHTFKGDTFLMILTPLIFLGVMFTSYFLWKKTTQTST